MCSPGEKRLENGKTGREMENWIDRSMQEWENA